jgi:hypothetical protein
LAIAIAGVFANQDCVSTPNPAPIGKYREEQVTPVHTMDNIQERKPELNEPESFITGRKHACLLAQREMLSLSHWTVSRPIFYSEGRQVILSRLWNI